MMSIHGITITRDQIYEFDYILRRFNQLKEEIFGVDYITELMDSESECSSDGMNEITVTTSALYCIKSMSEDFKPPISTEKIIPKSPSNIKPPEIVISQPLNDQNLSARSVISTHSAVKSEPPPIEEILKSEPSPIVEPPLPFLRSKINDSLMFEFITEDLTEELLAGNVQDELYDVLDEMIEGEIVAREMEAYISQNLEARSKAQRGKSQMSVDVNSLNEKTSSSKSFKKEKKESKNSLKSEKKESRKRDRKDRSKDRKPNETASKTSTKTDRSTRSEKSEKPSKSSVNSEERKSRKEKRRRSKDRSKSREEKEKRKKSKKKDAPVPVAASRKTSEISISLADSLVVPDKTKKKSFWKKLFSK